ncbi:MAG: hypothetical protein M1269_08945 [Chloroflexi bacterium]|nr:hypothetical protein [Chloroflexota bacterium]
MRTYIFSGKIFPERANVNIPASKSYGRFQTSNAVYDFEASLSIQVSQVSVIVNLSDDTIDLETLKNIIENLVRGEVDIYGYLSGLGYDVEITAVVEPNGNHRVFGVGIQSLHEAKDERPFSYKETWEIVGKSPFLQHALANLRESIKVPHDTGFFCYRAVESIRQNFRKNTNGNDKKSSWERMRNALRIDKSWIDKLKVYGDPQRHGELKPISGEDRILLMEHAWKVVDRFLIYLKRDSPLPVNEFPLLKESNQELG